MLYEKTQKITAYIPVNLLHQAQTRTKKGITETLKIALSQFVRANAYEALHKMRNHQKLLAKSWD